MKAKSLAALSLAVTLLGVTAFVGSCDTVDCTMNNAVALRCGFYNKGKQVAITDTLTVTTCGLDSILLNRKLNTSAMELPLSYHNQEDTLVLRINLKDETLEDTIWIKKENIPHFESPDCPTTMFHSITSLRWTDNFIDSLTIAKSAVNYDQTENIQIHLLAND